LLANWCVPRKPCSLGPPLQDAQVSIDGTVSQRFTRGTLVQRLDGKVVRVTPPSSGADTGNPDVPESGQARVS
jgi:hypothetical protein